VDAALGKEVDQGGIVLGIDSYSLEELAEHLILLLGLADEGFINAYGGGEIGHLCFAYDFKKNESRDNQGQDDQKPVFSCAHEEDWF
jgi:hypothetical protein